MQKVDAEIRRIIDEQYALARKLIEDNKDKIEAMTQALLEWETINSDQIKDIMEGRTPRPPQAPQAPQPPTEDKSKSAKTEEEKQPDAEPAVAEKSSQEAEA